MIRGMVVGSLHHAPKMRRYFAGQEKTELLRKPGGPVLCARHVCCCGSIAKKKHHRYWKISVDLQVFTLDGRICLFVRKRVAFELELAPKCGQLRRIAVTHVALKSGLPGEAWNSGVIGTHTPYGHQKNRDCSVACRPTCLASCVSPQPRVESVAGIAVRHFESGPHFAKTKNVILPNNEIEDCAKVHTFSV